MRPTIVVSITPGFAAVLGALAGIATARAPSQLVVVIACVLGCAALVIAGSMIVRAVSALRSTARTERMQRDAVNEYLAEQRRHNAKCHAQTQHHTQAVN